MAAGVFAGGAGAFIGGAGVFAGGAGVFAGGAGVFTGGAGVFAGGAGVFSGTAGATCSATGAACSATTAAGSADVFSGAAGAEEQKAGDEQKDGGQQPEEQPAAEQISINYNVYMRTANLIVYFIRKKEAEPESGLKQGDVERLVMKEREGDLETEQDVEREVKLLKFIVHRLIEVDHILLVKEDNAEDATQRLLIVHPNYDPDSRNTANLGVGDEETAYQKSARERAIKRRSPTKARR